MLSKRVAASEENRKNAGLHILMKVWCFLLLSAATRCESAIAGAGGVVPREQIQIAVDEFNKELHRIPDCHLQLKMVDDDDIFPRERRNIVTVTTKAVPGNTPICSVPPEEVLNFPRHLKEPPDQEELITVESVADEKSIQFIHTLLKEAKKGKDSKFAQFMFLARSSPALENVLRLARNQKIWGFVKGISFLEIMAEKATRFLETTGAKMKEAGLENVDEEDLLWAYEVLQAKALSTQDDSFLVPVAAFMPHHSEGATMHLAQTTNANVIITSQKPLEAGQEVSVKYPTYPKAIFLSHFGWTPSKEEHSEDIREGIPAAVPLPDESQLFPGCSWNDLYWHVWPRTGNPPINLIRCIRLVALHMDLEQEDTKRGSSRYQALMPIWQNNTYLYVWPPQTELRPFGKNWETADKVVLQWVKYTCDRYHKQLEDSKDQIPQELTGDLLESVLNARAEEELVWKSCADMHQMIDDTHSHSDSDELFHPELFEMADDDADGKLTIDEVHFIVVKYTLAEAHLPLIFDQMDTNKDKVVTKEEYIAWGARIAEEVEKENREQEL